MPSRSFSAPPKIRMILAAALCVVLLHGDPAEAQVLTGSLVIEPVPAGAAKTDTVTFELPGKMIIDGEPYRMENKQLVGTHTCTFDPTSVADAATDGHHVFYLRLNRGKKIGSVFLGQLTAGAGTLLFHAGCDGNPATEDAFQGDTTAMFAELAVYASQIMTAAEYHDDGKTVNDEVRETFAIETSHRLRKVKLIEQHDFDELNRGGTATGYASAKVKLIFRP